MDRTGSPAVEDQGLLNIVDDLCGAVGPCRDGDFDFFHGPPGGSEWIEIPAGLAVGHMAVVIIMIGVLYLLRIFGYQMTVAGKLQRTELPGERCTDTAAGRRSHKEQRVVRVFTNEPNRREKDREMSASSLTFD